MHIDKHSGKANIPTMGGDEVTDAFARWKVAHDAFLTAEQLLFATVSKRAHPSNMTNMRQADPQFAEVQAKRAEAERLLLVAMNLLHARRKPSVGG